MPRPPKPTAHLDKVAHLMGTMPDHDIAEMAGSTVSVVGRYRRKHGIAAYDGYKFGKADSADAGAKPAAKKKTASKKKATTKKTAAKKPAAKAASAKKTTKKTAAAASTAKPAAKKKAAAKKPAAKKTTRRRYRSKLDDHRDIVGKLPDRVVAERVGMSTEGVRMYRRRNGIPLIKSPPTKKTDGTPRKRAFRPRPSKLDPYSDLLGKVPDKEVATMAGVTSENVRAYRRKRGIPALWRQERKAAAAAPSPAVASTAKPAAAPAPAPAPAAAPASTNQSGQGYEVTVTHGKGSTNYIIVAGDIGTAATNSQALVAKRHANGQIVSIRHLGPALS